MSRSNLVSLPLRLSSLSSAMAIDVVSSHPHSPSVPRRCRSNSSANCSGVTLRLRPKADISHASIVPIRPYLQTFRPHGFGMTHTILQIIAQLLVRSWDNGWDNRRGSEVAHDNRLNLDAVWWTLLVIDRLNSFFFEL